MSMAPVGPMEDDEPTLDPRRLIDAVLRRRWLLVACTVLGGATGVVVSRFMQPEYQAMATIWVELGASSAAAQRGGPIQQGAMLENTNWIDLLRSFTVLDSVVKEQRLFVTAEDPRDTALLRSLDLKEQFRFGSYELRIAPDGRTFELSVKGGDVIQHGNVGDSIGQGIGLNWLPPRQLMRPGRTVAFAVATPRQAALDINQRLDTKLPPREGNFIRLTLVGSNPVLTASTLNSITEQFVHVAAELKKEKLTELSRILADQLQSSASDLRRSEAALETFRVSTITEPSDAAPPVVAGLQQTQAPAINSYFTMKTESDALRRDREAIENALRMPLDSGMTALALEGIPSVTASTDAHQALIDLTTKIATLRALRTRYTDSNPQVADLANQIRTIQTQQLPAMLRSIVNEIRAREATLNGRIETSARDLRQIPTRSIEEARLQREVQIADNLYTNLQARYSEARLAEASSIPDVRILDPAVVPDKPTRNMALLILIGGFGGGLALAVGLALLLDQFDRRLRYPDQVTRELGLHILGAVPRADAGDNNSEAASQVVEALRTVRLNVVHAYGTAGPLVTTITSPGSGDGKSFIASNLALAFADAGHRTLLIDGDIRRGTLHRALGVQRKPGLLDYLSGQATRETVVQHTKVSSVDFVACGTRKMGGPELLASPAMSQLLMGLRSQYSVIIIDSAPLGAGVDPLVLGSLTGSLLLVLRTGVTDRELATAKLSDLNRLPIRVLGAVLNDVKASGVYKYYSYLPGYRSDDEEDSGKVARKLPAGAS